MIIINRFVSLFCKLNHEKYIKRQQLDSQTDHVW